MLVLRSFASTGRVTLDAVGLRPGDLEEFDVRLLRLNCRRTERIFSRLDPNGGRAYDGGFESDWDRRT
jgi:hypothetical protein